MVFTVIEGEMYKLRDDIGGDHALEILRQLLDCLSEIESEKLTSLEFNILWACAQNPPTNGGDVVQRIPNRDIFENLHK